MLLKKEKFFGGIILFMLMSLFIQCKEEVIEPTETTTEHVIGNPTGSGSGSGTGDTDDGSKRNAFIFKVTSTGCTACGTNGIVVHESMEEFEREDVIVIEYHPSAEAVIDDMAVINDDWSLYGLYTFDALGEYYVGNEIVDNDMEMSDRKEWTGESIAAILEEDAPLYSVVGHSVAGSTISADVTIKVNHDHSADYALGVYLIEDEILYWQNGNPESGTYDDPTYYHKNVFRENMARHGSGIPESNMTGGFIKLNEFTETGEYVEGEDIVLPTISLPIDATWNSSNLRIAVLIVDQSGEPGIVNANHSNL